VSFSCVPAQVIDPVVNGTIFILKSAAAQPTVKSFVLTSSSYASIWPKQNIEFDITEDRWNDEAIEKAYSLAENDPLKPWHVYSASKVLQERAAWKFIKEEKPGFAMNTIMPNCTFGPMLDPAQPASTAGMLRELYKGNWPAFSGIVPRKSNIIAFKFKRLVDSVWVEWFVDVRDVGRLHLHALTSPSLSAGGARIWAVAEPFNTNDVLHILRKLYPGKSFLPDVEGLGRDLTHIDNKRGTELLGSWLGLEEGVKANVESFLACS
jgi:nucleoside-diphosphate-sugar epimerase